MSIAGGQYLIFVVEDNPADVLLIREALSEYQVNFALETYDTGERAIDALANRLESTTRQIPHLVLLDWNLPTVNGSEVLRQIRSWPHMNSLPVAVLTSSGSPRDRAEAYRLGATFFFQKPMDLDDFIHRVGRQISDVLEGRLQASSSDA